ncbi:Mambaquaretin-1 [Bulinus truncatus]|nr:Mambaquaretin-1 [Bulinus truncatus]
MSLMSQSFCVFVFLLLLQFSCQCKRGPCSLPVDSGPCDGLFIKYYYNTQSNTCESFNYGGCQGNANKFDTIRECKRRCMG